VPDLLIHREYVASPGGLRAAQVHTQGP
jgi:hypothetical protein